MHNGDRSIDVLAVMIDPGLMIENSAVYQSQVGDQLIALQSMGFHTGLLAVSGDQARFETVIGRRLRECGVQVFLLQDTGFFRNMNRMASVLRRLRVRTAIRSAYVRGLWGPVVLAWANPVKRIPYVYDVRGAVVDETIAVGTSTLKARVYGKLEAWGIRGATHVTAVTRFLADSVSAKHGRDKVYVIPCNVNVRDFVLSDAQVAEARQRLGYAGSDIVLVYSGGLSHYQEVPAMLDLWRRLLDEPDVKFLMMTRDDPQLHHDVVGDLSDFGTRLRVMPVPRDDVRRVLAAGTIGFMLRNGRELNRAASPVKFAEYLAAGLAIVASPATGDVSELVQQHNVGVLVDPNQLDEGEDRIRGLLRENRRSSEAFRQRSRALALARYDWNKYEAVYRHIYDVPTSKAQGVWDG